MKLSKKVTAIVLASLMTVSMAVSAFAATSPATGNSEIADGKATVEAKASGNVTGVKVSDGDATITAVKKTAKTVSLSTVVDAKGNSAVVTAIAKNTFKGTKATTVKVTKKLSKLTIKNGAFTGSKIKTLNLKKVTSVKLTKKNTAGLKKGAKVILSAKMYNKYAKSLKKWGFKPAKK